MNTPKTKGISLSMSKYLTPCRTTGLKRKSFSPVSANSILGSKLVSVSTPNSKRTPLRQLPSPEKRDSNPGYKPVKSEAVVSEEVLLEKSVKCIEELDLPNNLQLNLEVNKPIIERDEDHQPFVGFSNSQDIVQLINDINSLGNQVKQKRQQSEAYRKQHNISELQATTEVWKNAFKEVVVEIQETLRSRGAEISLANILKENGIALGDAGFNEEAMDFE